MNYCILIKTKRGYQRANYESATNRQALKPERDRIIATGVPAIVVRTDVNDRGPSKLQGNPFFNAEAIIKTQGYAKAQAKQLVKETE